MVETEEQIREKAAFLAEDSYKTREINTIVDYNNDTERFLVVDELHTNSGFDGNVYLDTKTNQLVVAIRGTES